jgi:predicted dehydrogenase
VEPVRIGALGAARITPNALIKPARRVPQAVAACVAARDRNRAERFAAKHGIRDVRDSYAALVEDDGVDAVYNPLPNSLHAPWTLRAIAAGKHVLCEKPFTSNAAEAEQVAAAASSAGVVVMEAFHYRYHPLAERMREIVHGADGTGGELGSVLHVEASVCFPLPRFSDIRYQYRLAGGAMMDAGCYAVHCLRLLGPGTPQVAAARAALHARDVDRAMTADFRFPGGATGRIEASLWSGRLLSVRARVIGERGRLSVLNYLAPQLYHRLRVTAGGWTRREHVRSESTYTYQLRAFADAVLTGGPVLTPPADAITNMRLIDDVYRAAGLPLRGEAAR